MDIAQSSAVYPSLHIQDLFTHLPLKVQSFGHIISVTFDKKEGIVPFSSVLLFTYDDRFLPAISPHSFISKVTAEIANEVSPVS